MTTAINSKPATDAFLPSGAIDHSLYPHQLQQERLQLQMQQQQHHHNPIDHRFSSSSSFSSNRLPSPNHAPTNGGNHNGNLASITSPPRPAPSGFPPATLPLPNESAVLSPPSYSSVPAPYSGPGVGASNPPLPLSKYHQRFRGSLSPIKQNQPATTQPLAPQRSDIPDVNGAASLYRSVSADASAATSTGSNQLVQRLAQQNALIREAWEAERNYLEANRRRAEEVYQEERVIMEEVREAWENEKAVLLRENQVLKERIQRLEGENATLRSIASQNVHAPGVMSPLASQRCDSTAVSDSGSGTSGPTVAHTQAPQAFAPVADPSSLPPGLDGAARRPHHFSPDRQSPGNSRLSSPTRQPEVSPFIPLDPRIQPQDAHPRDFLQPKESEDSVPVIDVQEVDPQLDGIQLKATAIQKNTFGKSGQSSPGTSPPAAESTPMEQRMGLQKRLSSKDHTIQVLRAEESRRLTMHAGHTPNHSLSLFPTMSVAGASTANTQDTDTAPSEGALSPAVEPNVEEKKSEHLEQNQQSEQDLSAAASPAAVEEPIIIEHIPVPEPELEDPEEQMAPAEDRRLKGPLMIKNIPAQDEIFWDQVNKKLEPISQGQDALPTVMRRASEEDTLAGPSGAHVVHAANAAVPPVGGDASHDLRSALDGPAGSHSGPKSVEPDVPLKLKTTTNFGAPFGIA